MIRIAIIGAGLSGLVLAHRLQEAAEVTVFEKSRGSGGRLSTRYAGDYEFDHGAQYFTARTEAFRSFLQPLIETGVVAEWRPAIAEFDGSKVTAVHDPDGVETRYVGAPRMNRIGKTLAGRLNVELERTVDRIERTDGHWTVTYNSGTQVGPYDWVVLAAPAVQSAKLGASYPELVAYCDARPMLGCFALMLGFEEPLPLAWQAARVHNHDVGWIAVNSSKPGRSDAYTLVVHSSNAWAEAHMEDDPEQVLDHLLEAASSVVAENLNHAAHKQLHRWRYANSEESAGAPYFLDADKQLAACGDWCIRGRIEEAFTSGDQLAKEFLRRL